MTQILLEPATGAQRFRQLQEFMAEEQSAATVDVLVEHGVSQKKFVFQPAPVKDAAQLPQDPLILAAFGPEGRYEQFTFTLYDQVQLTFARQGAEKLETLSVGNIQQQVDQPRRVLIIRRARRVFKAFEGSSIAAHLGPELATFYQAREGVLGRLESTLATMAERALQFTHDVEARMAEREQLREQQLAEQRAKLEAQHAARTQALEQAYQDHRAALEAKQSALDERAAELDDRDNTHARRKLRQDVKAELAKRSSEFSLSAGTTGKRGPVRVLCIAMMLSSALGLCAVIFGWTASTADWITVSRQLFFVLTFSATAVFYLRWENQWFQQHASEEFRLKRLDLDIDRASWVVETTLEYKHENREIPPELLKDLSRNLFAEPLSMGTVRHPVESLGDALLGASSQVRMKMGDAQVELDRRGMKKFEQSAIGDE